MIFPAPWLDPAVVDKSRLAIAQWALNRVGVYELPPGSNRSGLIDGWVKATGAPVGSSWCAAFAFSAWKENGEVPLGDAACQTWHANADKIGRFKSMPDIGDVALFDFGTLAGWADHCGIVVRLSPTVLTVEGNTNESGGREGVGVFLKDRGGQRCLGYVGLGV